MPLDTHFKMVKMATVMVCTFLSQFLKCLFKNVLAQ